MKNKRILLTPKNAGFFLITSSLLFTLSSWSLNHIRKEKGQSIGHNIRSLSSFQTENNNYKESENIFSNQGFISDNSNENISINSAVETNLFEGSIGSVDPNNWYDEASDNIFNVVLNNIDNNKDYTLTYQVQGLDNVASVTRSINQSLSLGGYVQSKSEKWNTVRENLDPTLLKNGINHILFNANGKKNFYKIRDVEIVENTNKTNDLFKINSKIYKDNTFYMRGFVNSKSNITAIQILDKNIKLEGNEFEYFNESISLKTELNLIFKDNHGNIVDNKTIKLDNREKSFETVSYNTAKETVVYKNTYGYLIGLRTIDVPPVDPSITNLGKDFDGYRYKSTSDIKSTIHIPYNKGHIPKGYSEADIAAFKFDYNKKRWERIRYDSINVEKEYLIVNNESKGDTDYINGIIKNPQSPETSSFTPTTINDIPVANPVSNVNLIAPPQANQQGSANVQYPIEIPAGVNGLQPNVALSYNSDSKSGWAGLGWDISAVETIDIDTRWGVPEFNSAKESEIYTIGGEQLVFDDNYLPNKVAELFWINRTSGDKAFYFRTGVKEGTKIIRKGAGPDSYTWEITGTDGSVKVYDIVIKDVSQNNVKWFLSTVTDVNGNTMTYAYNDETSSSNGGKNKYLRSITYSSNTVVEFENQPSERPDVISSYKLGVKLSDFRLLDKIIVKRAGVKIREYQLLYQDGDFEKKVLWKVMQKDGSGNDFARHEFGYKSYKTLEESLFSEENKKEITTPNDVANSGFAQGSMSMLSGVQGNSWNIKGALTFGVGFGASGNKKRTAGLNYTYSENETFGKSQLIDIDGDGLPDKVFFDKNGTIRYRKNLGDSFGIGSPLSTTGISGFPLSKGSSYSNSFGFEMSLKVVQGGITYSVTKGNSPVYFSDVNGDGLVDMVYYGKVFFNRIRLNTNNEISNFSAVEDNAQALSDTPNAILKGVPAPITTIPEETSNKLANIVRAWEAPFDGIINVNAYVRLDQDSKDGVEVWIEKGTLARDNENSPSLSPSEQLGSNITLNSQGQQQNIIQSSISVKKGQRIYIVASSKSNSTGDDLKTESNIEYQSVSGFSSQMSSKDINGNDFFKSNSKNSFLKSSAAGNAVIEKGSATISWPSLSSQTFSDDLNFKIYKSEKKASDTAALSMTEAPKLIFHQKLKRGQSLSQLLPDENLVGGSDIEKFDINPISSDTDPTLTFLYFEVTGDTNVSWEKIDWMPKLTIKTLESVEQHNMIVQYKPFSEVVKLNMINPATSFIATHTRIYPKFTDCYGQKLTLPNTNYSGAEVTFSIKFQNYNLNGVIIPLYTLKKKVKVENNKMEIPYIDNYGANPTYSQIAFEIHTDNYELGKYLSGLNPFIELLANNCFVKSTTIRPNYYSTRSETKNYNANIGLMWQGWGGFVYNGTKYANAAIKTIREGEFFVTPPTEEEFPLPNCGDPTSEDYESCMLNYLDNQQNSRYFTTLGLDPDNGTYISPLESANFGKDSIEPSNMFAQKPSATFEGDPKVVTAEPRGIIMHSKGNSLNIYGGIGGASINGGYSKDESAEVFQDINGDQYPDIVIGDKYYKTNLLGALTDGFSNIGDKTIKNNTKNIGAGFSWNTSINPEKQSNTQTSDKNTSVGEMVSHMGSSFAATGMGPSVNFAKSNSKNENIWLDINGDGLSDYISNNRVYINTGRGFTEESGWNIGEVFANETEATSGGGGVNLGNGSWVVGVGKNFSASKNKVFFIDMTGDGLLDKLVNENGKYSLYVNTGKSISGTAIPMGSDFTITNNQNTSGLNGYGTFCLAFGLKICLSLGGGKDSSTNKQTVDLRDFDGDGSPDLLISEDDTKITVVPNQANKFNLLNYIGNPLQGDIHLDYRKNNPISHTKVGSTYQMPFSKLVLTRYVVDDDEAFENKANKTNINQTGSTAVLDELFFEYENGVQDRRERSFLGFGKVKTIDRSGITQVTEYETNYANKQDFYVPYDNTSVRQYFYKKGLVRSTYTLDSIGRERSRVNYIYRYFDQPTTKYSLNQFQLEPTYKDIGRIIPFLYSTETVTTEYNGNIPYSKRLISTVDEYNQYGNVLSYTDRGKDIDNTTDDIKITIAYHPVTSQNVGGIPQEHKVADASNAVLRRSLTLIDAKGNISSIKRILDRRTYEYNYEYDSYGNLKKSIFPLDQNGKRMFYEYEYDPTYHTYITKTTDAYGYSSTTQYDPNYLFGVPKTVTDLNNVSSTYTYDGFGRLTQYRSPVDNDWTIKLHYDAGSDGLLPNVAVTERKAPAVNGVLPGLNYFSSLFVDTWGRELSVKKLIGGTANNYIYSYKEGPIKDEKGRAKMQYINNIASREHGNIMDVMKIPFIDQNSVLNPDFYKQIIRYNYDELDRVVKIIQPNVETSNGPQSLVKQTVYGFGNDRNGIAQFTQKTISPMGKNSTTYTDEKGRTTSVVQNGDNTNLWTDYTYDLLGQLIKVRDQNQHITEYSYDGLGRRTSETHPDAGISNYYYDGTNKLVAFDNPALRDQEQQIIYNYNFNQLTEITYPDHVVKYEYGLPGASNYSAGRLIKQTDRTGIQMFKYSMLGQVVEEKRFMIAPNETAKVFKTNYIYDVHNRINSITYPDNELVLYSYDAFGLLNNIKSLAPGTGIESDIVSSISYDYNEQMTEVVAGNGTRTQYQRDSWGKLESLLLQGAPNPMMPDILAPTIRSNSYTYDNDNNVTGITTSVPLGINNAVLNGVASEKTFTYDGFNRLKSSLIKATGTEEKKYYQLDMTYNNSHGIASKHSRWKTYSPGICSKPGKEGSKMVYHYDDVTHPNAVSSITSTIGGAYTTPWDCGTGFTVAAMDTHEYYTYDANGNMTLVEGDESGGISDPNSLPERTVKRQLFWDIQNHLKGIAQDNALHHYVYDATGERSLKSEGNVRNIFTNGNMGSGRPRTTMEPYTYYPNGYAVVNGAQLSKHYYIGSNKVAAKVTDLPSHGFASEAIPALNELSGTSMIEVESMVQEAGYPPVAWADLDNSELETEETCSNAVLAAASNFNPRTNCYRRLMSGYNEALLNGTVCEFWHNFQLDDCMIDQPVDELQEYQTYWVHPDHLGSGSVITNQAGTTTNWYEYMPFGEILMEQSSGEYNNVYKYNGKEFDEATQLYYYGARYYNPRVSLWLNVDPLAIYHPVNETEFYGDGQHNGGVFNSGNLNAYIYCYQNPIIYVDPNGKQGYFMTPPGNINTQGMKMGGMALGFVGAAVLDAYVTKGRASQALLAYTAGEAFHSMEMQSYWRTRGNEDAAKKYEQEGADATRELAIIGGLSATTRILSKAFTPLMKLCFVKGTLISTLEGFKKIEDIEVGDSVWSYNESTSKSELKKVIALSTNIASDIIRFNADGIQIESTPEHPFYINGKWIEAKNLKKGDELYLKDGSKCVIISIKKYQKEQVVYNFEVEDNHNYYVSEKQILVHNDCGFLKTNNKHINREIIKVAGGNGTPRLDDAGLPKVFGNRKNTSLEKRWEGSTEYNVPGQPSGDNYRILEKLNPDGSKKYGYTLDHYKTIHEIKQVR